MKIIQPASAPRFIRTLPPNLKGTCDVCWCQVQTEGNEQNDGEQYRWHSTEDYRERGTQGWQVKCPTPGCSNWIWIKSDNQRSISDVKERE